jgi:hypothetical protein
LQNLMPAPARPAAGPPPAYRPGFPPPPPGYRPPLAGPPAPAGPPRKLHWWRDANVGIKLLVIGGGIFGVLLAGLAVLAGLGVKLGGAPDTIKFDLVACEYSGDPLPAARAEFKVTNSGDSDYRLTIKWEFRDRDGARIDTDTTRVTVPAGQTVRDAETTLLPVAIHGAGGTCGYSLS